MAKVGEVPTPCQGMAASLTEADASSGGDY
jgi:hypothetical protein